MWFSDQKLKSYLLHLHNVTFWKVQTYRHHWGLNENLFTYMWDVKYKKMIWNLFKKKQKKTFYQQKVD